MNSKVTVKHYVNPYLNPKTSDKKGDHKLYYPLYVIVIYMRTNTQVRSLTQAWFTRKGLQEFNETGTLDDAEVLAVNKKGLKEQLDREVKLISEIVKARVKNIGMDVPIPYGKTYFPRLIPVASLSAREYVSTVVWEYLANSNDKLREFLDCINTHKTRDELELHAVSLPHFDIPAEDDLWQFTDLKVPADVDVFEWYLNGYERVKNINPLFDELFTEAIRHNLTVFNHGIY